MKCDQLLDMIFEYEQENEVKPFLIEINKKCLRELQADAVAESFIGLKRVSKRQFFNTFADIPLAITNNAKKVTFHTKESIEQRLSL